MKIISFIAIILVLCHVTLADCGLSGDLYVRINECGKATKHLKLVYQHEDIEAWLHVPTSTLYVAESKDRNAKNWYQSHKNCIDLNGSSHLAELVSEEWAMPSYQKFPNLDLIEGFQEMRYKGMGYPEYRYWMVETFNHPSGKLWAAYYSNQMFYERWVADAGDLIYRSICKAAVK